MSVGRLDTGEDRLVGGESHRKAGIPFNAHHHAIGLPEDACGKVSLRTSRLKRHVACVMAENLRLAIRQDDELEMRQLYGGRIDAEVPVNARAYVVVQRLPAL